MQRRTGVTVAVWSLTACTPTPMLHDASQFRQDRDYLCMAPDGSLAAERYDGSSIVCPAPARFVTQPFCRAVPAAPRDNTRYFRARARAARDGSLQGDAFEGQPFCAVRKSGPPLP